jgi:hypothetical protein
MIDRRSKILTGPAYVVRWAGLKSTLSTEPRQKIGRSLPLHSKGKQGLNT